MHCVANALYIILEGGCNVNKSQTKECQISSILASCFKCMKKRGLEETSTRDFSDVTGMTASSLYYWFKNKDDIVIQTAEFGYKQSVVDILREISKKISYTYFLHDDFYDLIKKHEKSLRLVFQIANSPKYGDYIREYDKQMTSIYDEYTVDFAKKLGISYEGLRPVVDIFVSVVCDYLTWNNEEKFRRELKSFSSILGRLKHKENKRHNVPVEDFEVPCDDKKY